MAWLEKSRARKPLAIDTPSLSYINGNHGPCLEISVAEKRHDPHGGVVWGPRYRLALTFPEALKFAEFVADWTTNMALRIRGAVGDATTPQERAAILRKLADMIERGELP